MWTFQAYSLSIEHSRVEARDQTLTGTVGFRGINTGRLATSMIYVVSKVDVLLTLVVFCLNSE